MEYLPNNPVHSGKAYLLPLTGATPLIRGTLSILFVIGTAPVGESPQGFQHGVNPALCEEHGRGGVVAHELYGATPTMRRRHGPP